EFAVALSHVCAMLLAFVLMRLFVFSASEKAIELELLGFASVNVASLTQTWIVAVGLGRFVWPVVGVTFYPEFVAHFLGLSTSALTSYVGHQRVSFARKAAGEPQGGALTTVEVPSTGGES